MVHALRTRRLSNRESRARLLRSLTILYVGGEWQWLVCCNGRDLPEGAARENIDWKAEGIRSSALEFVACDIFGLSTGLDIDRQIPEANEIAKCHFNDQNSN